jgi:hypothetical protein
MYQLIMNRFDSPQHLDVKSGIGGPDDTDPPPNIHGDKVFMVKMQAALDAAGNNSVNMPQHIFIYDRQKSFQVYMMPVDDELAFAEAAIAIRMTGWKGLKMYRWAKRTGDFELTVCFDRAPENDPQW